MWLRGEPARARDPSADRTEGHTRAPLSAQTSEPDLRDALHANERSLPCRHRGRPSTKDVRRATSPLNASVPANTANGAYGNWTCPRVLSETVCRQRRRTWHCRSRRCQYWGRMALGRDLPGAGSPRPVRQGGRRVGHSRRRPVWCCRPVRHPDRRTGQLDCAGARSPLPVGQVRCPVRGSGYGLDILNGDPSGAAQLSENLTRGPDTRGVQVLAVLAVSETLSDRVRHPEREVPVHATLDIDMTCCVPAGLSLSGAYSRSRLNCL